MTYHRLFFYFISAKLCYHIKDEAIGAERVTIRYMTYACITVVVKILGHTREGGICTVATKSRFTCIGLIRPHYLLNKNCSHFRGVAFGERGRIKCMHIKSGRDSGPYYRGWHL